MLRLLDHQRIGSQPRGLRAQKKSPLHRRGLTACAVLVAALAFAGAPKHSAAVSVEANPSAQLAQSASRTPIVKGVRIGAHEGYTRFVLELSSRVPYRLLSLADPYRVVIDLPEVAWPNRLQPLSAARGVVGQYRFGLFRQGVSRFVIDLTQPAIVARHFRLPAADGAGGRLVIDLRASDVRGFAAAPSGAQSDDWAAYAGSEAAAPQGPAVVAAEPRAAPARRTTAPAGPRAPSPRERRVVVLDPGHGGVDPGAIGASGVFEKTIVLSFAREFRSQLERSGRYRVVMTRDSDVFVKLRDRYEVAHRAGGELFISVHADAHATNRPRGLSVYTLSETASDREAAALAARENKSDILAGYDLTGYDDQTAYILLDLAQRKTSESSWQFAQTLVETFQGDVRLLRRPHRFAGFAVLKSPTVPSVLVELGYLSNRSDEAKLKSAEYRRQVGAALLRTIDAYFAEQEKLSRS